MDSHNDDENMLNVSNPSTMILVVDDEERNRQILTIQLTNASYDCCEAKSGDAAYAMVRSHAPGIILLDVMMPNIDGY